tara:strand:+ start:1172 stop:1582 length:411 start_codon:yes stop_codon:yes gene_type:complete
VKLNRKKLRKMILQELILVGAPRSPSKFNEDDEDFARALRQFARHYPESQITIDLSGNGVGIVSASGAFPPVTLKTSGVDYTSRDNTIYISGPGGLSGQFGDSFRSGGNLSGVEVAARVILARLHGSDSPEDEFYY